jgi:hypothetical protein
MLKIRQSHVERAIGFLAALAVFCFLQIAWEFQDLNCHRQQHGAATAPADEQKVAPTPQPQGQSGDAEVGKHPKAKPAFPCGIISFPAAIISFMDHHEGFFVGAFTFLLFVSTTLLWRATADLWEAGEQQIAIAQQTLATSTKAATTLASMERAYLGGGGDCQIDPNTGERSFRVEVGNHGKTPAFLTAYGIEFATMAIVRGQLMPVRRRTHSDQFPPGERHRPVGALRPIPVTVPPIDIVYGAFWYRDIWGGPHCYRFILRIGEDGHAHSDVRGVDERYRRVDWADWG